MAASFRVCGVVVALLVTASIATETYQLYMTSAGVPKGCRIATLEDFQSAAFAEQYNRDGYLLAHGPIAATTDCGVNVNQTNGAGLGRLMFDNQGYDFIVTYDVNGSSIEGCGLLPYSTKISLGENENRGRWATITPEIQKASVVGEYNAISTELIACGGAPTSATFYLSEYVNGVPEGCVVATLADFQSAEFAAEYNQHGYLPVKSPIANTTDCGIDVLQDVGGPPGRLMFNNLTFDFVVTYDPNGGGVEGCSLLPYGDKIAFGENENRGIWTTITPAMQAAAAFGSFLAPGSVALLKCGGAPPPPPNPTPAISGKFRLAQYSNQTMSLPEGCKVASIADFQGAAFAAQYNAAGSLPVEGIIDQGTDCGINVLAEDGTTPGRLIYNAAMPYDFVVVYPPGGGDQLCDGPYSAQMALGENGDDGYWPSITPAIQTAAGVGSFYPPGSIALLNCASEPSITYHLAQDVTSRGVVEWPGCSLATVADFQSAAFAKQYNSVGFLTVLGTIDTGIDCGINILQTEGGQPGRLLDSGNFVVVHPAGGGPEICNGPYVANMSLGANGDGAYWPTITPAIQSAAAYSDSFFPGGSIALLKCNTTTRGSLPSSSARRAQSSSLRHATHKATMDRRPSKPAVPSRVRRE